MAIQTGPVIPGLGVKYTSPAASNNTWTYYDPRTATTSQSKVQTPKTTQPPATAASALGLGNARQGTPASVQKPASSSKPASQTTLIPAGLDAAGRAGGANISTTSTGTIRATAPTPSIYDSDYAQTPGANLPSGTTPIPDLTGSAGGGQQGGTQQGGGAAGGEASSGGTGGGGSQAPGSEPGVPATSSAGNVDPQAALDAAIDALLRGDYIGFQGDRAAELRRLQNLRNQLFGDAEFGSTGSVQRQQTLDANARRRLAAQRAMSGMLQGGSYAGTERGLGTIQRAEQDYAMNEMLRPFREQTAADRLREFGLEFDPTSRVFDIMDFGDGQGGGDFLSGWSTRTQAGREAAFRARQAALAQLAQRGIQI